MYLQCTTEESIQRQRQFEMVLLENMAFAQYGQITVGQLSAQVGVSRNAFYRYFDSKDDVLCALIDHTLEGFDPNQAEDHPHNKRCRAGIEAFLRYWKQNKPLLDALERNSLDGVFLDRCMKYTIGRTLDSELCHILDRGKYRYHVTRFVVNGLFGIILDWHHSGYAQTVSEMVDVVERVLTQPIVHSSLL